MRIRFWSMMVCLCALGTGAAADDDDLVLRLRVLDEQVPAGGIVQMKVRTYEVTPISTGAFRMDFNAAFFDRIYGIGIFATEGEVAGAAVIDGNQAAVSYVTTQPLTGDGYPFLTLSLGVQPGLVPGSQAQFTLDPSSRWKVGGTILPTKIRPGAVTVGGSVAISDVIPGEGWFPAGTVVSVRGKGFNSRSRLRVEDMSITSVRVISATEIRFTLRDAANITAKRVRVDNSDDSVSTYYAYMRGIPAATSGRALLAATYPIFSGTTRSLSTLGPLPDMNTAQYAALALQNPNLMAANVTIELYGADGSLLHSAARTLRNGYRLALELSELLDGVPPPAGASVRVISSLPIEAFGLLCDEETRAVTPSLPVEAGSTSDDGSFGPG